MIELKCGGCGWNGHVPDHYVGRRVTCKHCGDTNVVPDSITKEFEVHTQTEAVDPASDLSTVEVDCTFSNFGAN
jgi:hypothetical protein